MNVVRKKILFNLLGGAIVVLWLFMIGLLVKKVNYTDFAERADLMGKTSGIRSPRSDWMEIYLKDEKVGYSVNHVSPVEDDYLIQEEIFLKMNLMGQVSVLHSTTRCVVGPRFLLKTFKFKMTSGVVAFQVSGNVEDDRMNLEIGEGKARRREYVQLSETPVIGAAMAQFFKNRNVEVGQAFTFPVFDPSTMAQKKVTLEAKVRETLTIKRIEYEALRLETEMWGHNLAFWLDKDGSVLKQQGFMGMTLIRSSADAAPRGIKGRGGRDLYEQVAVRVKSKLQRPDGLTYLKLKVLGLDETDFDTAVLNEGRQKYHEGILEITKEKIPTTNRPGLPYTDLSEETKRLLEAEIGIESDHHAITKKAHEIAGDIRDPVIAAKKLLEWVHGNVEKRPVISVPSAAEVLKTMVGDCNEHAVLLAALLRASGIPARLCVGLVYARGMFLYHAWCEIYVGQWVSADPTFNQIPADVSHLKFVHAGPTRRAAV
ncbi:MAG: transglutaminase domain-containing protein, partial [Deltaproteobacteria bacterium]|nr:transglutaminase domain-containing protein [Deltaproteobacteria bacterium]